MTIAGMDQTKLDAVSYQFVPQIYFHLTGVNTESFTRVNKESLARVDTRSLTGMDAGSLTGVDAGSLTWRETGRSLKDSDVSTLNISEIFWNVE